MKDPSFKIHMVVGIILATSIAMLFMSYQPELGRKENAASSPETSVDEKPTPSFRAMSLSQLLSEAKDGKVPLAPVDSRWVSFMDDGDGGAMALIWVSDANSGAAYPYVMHEDDLCVTWDVEEGEGAFVSQTEGGMDPKTEQEYGRRYVVHVPASAKGDLALSTDGDVIVTPAAS